MRPRLTTPDAAARDAYTRLLSRLPPDTETLWREVEPLLKREAGVFVLDDSTLDKPYARQIELVTRHWSGKHRQVVQGINLQSLVWSDGEKVLPTDCRLYAKAEDGSTKNEHARAMFKYLQGEFAPANSPEWSEYG